LQLQPGRQLWQQWSARCEELPADLEDDAALRLLLGFAMLAADGRHELPVAVAGMALRRAEQDPYRVDVQVCSPRQVALR
jgi:hypothetical protein